MEDPLVLAKHYFDLALQTHETAELEIDDMRRANLLKLSDEFERPAQHLVKMRNFSLVKSD